MSPNPRPTCYPLPDLPFLLFATPTSISNEIPVCPTLSPFRFLFPFSLLFFFFVRSDLSLNISGETPEMNFPNRSVFSKAPFLFYFCILEFFVFVFCLNAIVHDSAVESSRASPGDRRSIKQAYQAALGSCAESQ